MQTSKHQNGAARSMDTAWMSEPVRTRSFGQDYTLTFVDRLGTWLSSRRILREVGDLAGKRLGDFGCGFEARFTRQVLSAVDHAVVVDVALAPDLKSNTRIRAIEGRLPEVLHTVPDASLDVIVCVSVLEHLLKPEATICEIRRLLAPSGACLVNVPSWRGKAALEFSAFRLGLSPAAEMDDHKRYYDPQDLWPLLVAAGFLPHQIRCRRHKLGLNTIATCRLD